MSILIHIILFMYSSNSSNVVHALFQTSRAGIIQESVLRPKLLNILFTQMTFLPLAKPKQSIAIKIIQHFILTYLAQLLQSYFSFTMNSY